MVRLYRTFSNLIYTVVTRYRMEGSRYRSRYRMEGIGGTAAGTVWKATGTIAGTAAGTVWKAAGTVVGTVLKPVPQPLPYGKAAGTVVGTIWKAAGTTASTIAGTMEGNRYHRHDIREYKMCRAFSLSYHGF